ncbi:hypothetical protein [Helicobacter macacae]|uniref:hypothetical protein n=1 Tax=Helicobacter macacae TaxID=398626 RepID=UPI0011DD9222|nr:hypothetical protein [Helicobacter macacae]
MNRLRIKCELLFRHCEILRSKIVAIQNSPSIAEGVRVWVIRIFVIASECVAQTRQSTFARHCEIRQRRIEAIQKKMWIATNRYAIPTMTMSVARQ